MQAQTLPVREYIDYLHRHPVPELISPECLEALSAVEAQYGDRRSPCAIMEARLAEEAAYIDFSVCVPDSTVPQLPCVWHEMDYGVFRTAHETGRRIPTPCRFIDTQGWTLDALVQGPLPAFWGEQRMRTLLSRLESAWRKLSEGAHIKYVGVMARPGEDDISRLCVSFPTWEAAYQWLDDMRWPGDVGQLRQATKPWQEYRNVLFDVDLSEAGLLSRFGFEVDTPWRAPELIDRFIARLERAGLCLSSKARGLSRFARLVPETDPLMQPQIAYFKLNYAEGRIAEAKAYLSLSANLTHLSFSHYDRPAYVDLVVKASDRSGAPAGKLQDARAVKDAHDALGSQELPLECAERWLRECEANRVRRVQFRGDVMGYKGLERLLEKCRSGGLHATVEMQGRASGAWIAQIGAAGANRVVVDEGALSPEDLKRLGHRDGLCLALRWTMHAGNASELADTIRAAEELGFDELVLAAAEAGGPEGPPTDTQVEQAAALLRERNAMAPRHAGGSLAIRIDRCFHRLKVAVGNEGIARGCMTGRDFFCVLPTGEVTPCPRLNLREGASDLGCYWTQSAKLAELRAAKSNAPRPCDARVASPSS